MSRRLPLLLILGIILLVAAPRPAAPVNPPGSPLAVTTTGLEQPTGAPPDASAAALGTEAATADTRGGAPSPTAMTIAPAMAHNPHPPGSAELSTIATWYAWRPNEAAAGPALRAFLGAHWRGTVVEVCRAVDAPEICVWTRLSDFCRCPGDHGIDLDSRSFVVLAPLSKGVLSVTVRRVP